MHALNRNRANSPCKRRQRLKHLLSLRLVLGLTIPSDYQRSAIVTLQGLVQRQIAWHCRWLARLCGSRCLPAGCAFQSQHLQGRVCTDQLLCAMQLSPCRPTIHTLCQHMWGHVTPFTGAACPNCIEKHMLCFVCSFTPQSLAAGPTHLQQTPFSSACNPSLQHALPYNSVWRSTCTWLVCCNPNSPTVPG